MPQHYSLFDELDREPDTSYQQRETQYGGPRVGQEELFRRMIQQQQMQQQMPQQRMMPQQMPQMPMQPMPQMIQQFGAGTGLSDADRRMFMNQPSQMIQQFGAGSGLSDMDRQMMQRQMMQQQMPPIDPFKQMELEIIRQQMMNGR
jgi:hypothetical protein